MQAFEHKSFNELFDLTGKTAIVTGGANGIGKATALRLAQAGANIVIADLKLEDANKAAKEIEGYGVKALAVECNILRDEDLVAMVDKTVEVFGSINILISNAGGGGGGQENPFKITVDDFRRDFELNVFSAWRLCQLCVPYMKKSGYGSIVITTS
ncbi:SDR family NAD(P)-dependent oxidoreductase, partial [Psychrobacter maritimus]|uniref:SDR family NAD(P)-dependent oxidoreductase n=1 Tax=Psychrobacter maritimus TaxID=256325 RepID=UPI003566820E